MKKELPERIIGRFKSIFCGSLIVRHEWLDAVTFLMYLISLNDACLRLAHRHHDREKVHWPCTDFRLALRGIWYMHKYCRVLGTVFT